MDLLSEIFVLGTMAIGKRGFQQLSAHCRFLAPKTGPVSPKTGIRSRTLAPGSIAYTERRTMVLKGSKLELSSGEILGAEVGEFSIEIRWVKMECVVVTGEASFPQRVEAHSG